MRFLCWFWVAVFNCLVCDFCLVDCVVCAIWICLFMFIVCCLTSGVCCIYLVVDLWLRIVGLLNSVAFYVFRLLVWLFTLFCLIYLLLSTLLVGCLFGAWVVVCLFGLRFVCVLILFWILCSSGICFVGRIDGIVGFYLIVGCSSYWFWICLDLCCLVVCWWVFVW